MEGQLTVYFEDPFWVGVFERSDQQGYAVARLVLGAEPSDAVLYRWVMEAYPQLAFSLPGPRPEATDKPLSFKRRQREAQRQAETPGVGTRAQRALQAERERQKQTRQVQTRAEREAEAQAKFERRSERKKEKHRGR